MTRPALCILAALALLLASRRPAWRPFAHQLAALACIDLARLWVSPLAQARAQPWWSLDVALVALWPVVLAWGLRVERVGVVVKAGNLGTHSPSVPRKVMLPTRTPYCRRNDSQDARAQVAHAATLPRLCALAAFELALGVARPWLPRLAYLCALRVPRWALAALWVEALVWLKDEGPRPKPEPLPARVAPTPWGASTGGCCERHDPGAEHYHAHGARLAQACALILAGTNAVDLLAGAWLVPPWEAPAWGYARAVTWAAYAAVACVMGRAWRRGG